MQARNDSRGGLVAHSNMQAVNLSRNAKHPVPFTPSEVAGISPGTDEYKDQSNIIRSALETLETIHALEMQSLRDEVYELRSSRNMRHVITPVVPARLFLETPLTPSVSDTGPHSPPSGRLHMHMRRSLMQPSHAEPVWEGLEQVAQKVDELPTESFSSTQVAVLSQSSAAHEPPKETVVVSPSSRSSLKRLLSFTGANKILGGRTRTLSIARTSIDSKPESITGPLSPSFATANKFFGGSNRTRTLSIARSSIDGAAESSTESGSRTNRRSVNTLATKNSVDTKGTLGSSLEESRRKERAITKSTTLGQNYKIPEEEEDETGILEHIVLSNAFELFFAITIVMNSLFLGVRIHVAMTSQDEDHIAFQVIDLLFTIAFTIELLARLGVDGCRVFWTRGKMFWFYLDAICVIASWAEMLFSFEGSAFRVMRNFRLVKLLRVARLVRFVRSLRTLVLSIAHTLKSVVWAFVLLAIIIYVFSLVFAQSIGSFFQSNEDIPSELVLFWGTLPRTMFTLFKSIAAGISWHEVVIILAEVDGALVALFILYISFVVFAFMNVITGIFCEAAIESAKQDHETMIHQVLIEKEMFTNAIRTLFGVSVDNEDFVLSYAEFESVLFNPTTRAHLAALQLDTEDAWELFKLLDTDESAFIDVEEFVNGCLRLKGVAKSVDIAKLSYDSRSRHKRLMRLMSQLDGRITDVVFTLNSFVSSAGKTLKSNFSNHSLTRLGADQQVKH